MLRSLGLCMSLLVLVAPKPNHHCTATMIVLMSTFFFSYVTALPTK
jgi:hypothetical protein